jgi:hypothetical protein
MAAAEPPAPPPQAAQPEKPDSVFSWGPWAGQPQSAPGDAPSGGGGANPSGVLPGVSVAANSSGSGGAPGTNSGGGGGGGGGAVTPPPVVTPPAGSNVRPGFGFGDRNHTHIPRKDR